jgi:hypothetical protein
VYDPDASGITSEIVGERGARRLDSTDNSNDVLEGNIDNASARVTISVNPEDFYLYQNETAMVLHCTQGTLTDLMWNPHLHLVIYATELTLPWGTMKFIADDVSDYSIVSIQAAEVVVPPQNTTIDLSGYDGMAPDNPLDGNASSQNGASGAMGRPGGPGGVFELQVGIIRGGTLFVNVNGGMGGKGQDGGHGYRGENGGTQPDKTACCEGRSTKGLPGLPGGSGGAGGVGGSGGSAGRAVVMYSEMQTDAPKVQLEAKGGLAGAGGAPGKGGSGGLGGPGAPTQCVRFGWFWRDKRCFLPLGEGGDTGIEGSTGAVPDPGLSGEDGEEGLLSVSLANMRAGACTAQMTYDYWYANQLYAKGQWSEAVTVYRWIEAVNVTSADGFCASVFPHSASWKMLAAESTAKIAQINQQLDYWGSKRNMAPMESFDSLYQRAQTLMELGHNAEAAFDEYNREATTNDARMQLIAQAIKNLDFEIDQAALRMETLAMNIQTVRNEVKDAEVAQTVARSVMTGRGQHCDAAIKKKAQAETYGWQPTLERFGNWAAQTVAEVQRQGLQIYQHSLVLYTLFQALPSEASNLAAAASIPVVNSLQSANTAANQGIAQINVLKSTTTRITSTLGTTENQIQNLNNTLRTIDAQWKSQGQSEYDKNVRVMADTKYSDAISEWMADVPECEETNTLFKRLVNKTTDLDMLIQRHDADIVEFASLQAKIKLLSEQRADLVYEGQHSFEPNAQKNMVVMWTEYFSLKDQIERLLRLMRMAIDYEFCETSDFEIAHPSRILQLQSYMLDLVTTRSEKLSYEAQGRSILAVNPHSLLLRGPQPGAVLVVNFPRTTDDPGWTEFDTTAKGYSFDLNEQDLGLQGAVNIRVISVQASFETSSNLARKHAWVRHGGLSKCRSSDGVLREFSHAPQTWTSVYTQTDADNTPKWLTDNVYKGDQVGVAPFGKWTISIPDMLAEADRRLVSGFSLHLIVSFEACETGDCSR